MGVSYNQYTYNDPFVLKRWLHRKRFDHAIKMLDLRNNDDVLDYGCGDGQFLLLSFRKNVGKSFFGYEPSETMFRQANKNLKDTSVRIYKSLDDFEGKHFNKITCLETCEHLTDEDLSKLFKNIKSLSNKDGIILFSVPIEIGIPALLKNTYRLLNRKKYENLNFKNYLKSIIGGSIEKKVGKIDHGVDYIFSHIGFSHRQFEKRLKKDFIVEKKHCLPFQFFGPVLNNIVYYRCIIR